MANILIGISGSIAAYKTVLLIRELSKQGHHCKVILSQGGLKFVTPELIAGLGCSVYSDESINFKDPKQAMLHIELAKWAERFIIAPASANTLAKLAHGIADNLLCEVALAYANYPIYLAPAMNQQMWQNSRTKINLQLLEQADFTIWQPETGLQACGDIGYGRMLEAEQLLKLTQQTFAATTFFSNKVILITLGASVEAIDPVRFLSNHSSGKMGLALIKQALALGAQVIAIHGNLNITLPKHPNLQSIPALSCSEMLMASLQFAADADIVIGCAAVCDYRIATPNRQKIKKSGENLSLELIKNPDIIASLKRQFPNLIVAGFAAETENLLANAAQKLQQKNLDLVIANNVANSQVFNQELTSISLLTPNGKIKNLVQMTKASAAGHIFEAIEEIRKCQ